MELEEEKMIEEIKKILDDKIRKGKRIMILDIARLLIKAQKKHDEEILDQEVWKLAKRISTNKSYAEFIKKGQKRVEENRKKIIKNVIEELKTKNENITILKLRLLTGLPKNYLYSEEIENYIEELKQF